MSLMLPLSVAMTSSTDPPARSSIACLVLTTGIGHDAPFTSSVSAMSNASLIVGRTPDTVLELLHNTTPIVKTLMVCSSANAVLSSDHQAGDEVGLSPPDETGLTPACFRLHRRHCSFRQQSRPRAMRLPVYSVLGRQWPRTPASGYRPLHRCYC